MENEVFDLIEKALERDFFVTEYQDDELFGFEISTEQNKLKKGLYINLIRKIFPNAFKHSSDTPLLSYSKEFVCGEINEEILDEILKNTDWNIDYLEYDDIPLLFLYLYLRKENKKELDFFLEEMLYKEEFFNSIVDVAKSKGVVLDDSDKAFQYVLDNTDFFLQYSKKELEESGNLEYADMLDGFLDDATCLEKIVILRHPKGQEKLDAKGEEKIKRWAQMLDYAYPAFTRDSVWFNKPSEYIFINGLVPAIDSYGRLNSEFDLGVGNNALLAMILIDIILKEGAPLCKK